LFDLGTEYKQHYAQKAESPSFLQKEGFFAVDSVSFLIK